MAGSDWTGRRSLYIRLKKEKLDEWQLYVRLDEQLDRKEVLVDLIGRGKACGVATVR
jgi:hypothetical protein